MDLTTAFEEWRLSGDRLTELIRKTTASLEKREFEVAYAEIQLAKNTVSTVESQLAAIREQAFEDAKNIVKDSFIKLIKIKRQAFNEQSHNYKLLTQLINDISSQ